MRKLTAERWQRIAVVLDTALELSPELCPPFLDIACAGDPELRRGVERFLAVDASLRKGHVSSADGSNGHATATPRDPLASVFARIQEVHRAPDESAGSTPSGPDSPAVSVLDRALNRLAALDEPLARRILLHAKSRREGRTDVAEGSASETDVRKASILLYEALREAT
jgi:hypothetical protein